jgi:hypothetical protein
LTEKNLRKPQLPLSEGEVTQKGFQSYILRILTTIFFILIFMKRFTIKALVND